MSSIVTLNNQLRQVQQQIIAAEQTLNQAKQAHGTAHQQWIINAINDYGKRRRALYMGEKNEYHCPTLYSNRSKREECTAALTTWVTQQTPVITQYNAAMQKTRLDLANAESDLRTLESSEESLKTQIGKLQEVDATLATQGKTADSVMRGVEILAQETAAAERESIEAQTAAFIEKSKLDAQAKQTRNMIFIGLGVIALIVVGVVVYRKFIAKKKKGAK